MFIRQQCRNLGTGKRIAKGTARNILKQARLGNMRAIGYGNEMSLRIKRHECVTLRNHSQKVCITELTIIKIDCLI